MSPHYGIAAEEVSLDWPLLGCEVFTLTGEGSRYLEIP
jgi:hypothetical protein